MNKKKILLVYLQASLLLQIYAQTDTRLQKPCSGRVERMENFSSKWVEARHIDVWLPAHYDGNKKFAVLYMHDGQMLYDAETTWNKQAWQVDDVLSKLMQEAKIQDVIVVGVWNSGKGRHADYFPQKPFESLSDLERDSVSLQLQRLGRAQAIFQPHSDNYLKFLVKELKPVIDKKYKVYTDKKHTFVAGSSMGGLISMYALCEYPHVFGGAACLSTHWTGTFAVENNPIPAAFLRYLQQNISKKNKIYFDCGNQTLDALYPPIQQQVDECLRKKGFTEKNWKSMYFPGKEHSENAWHERLHIPLMFLLAQ